MMKYRGKKRPYTGSRGGSTPAAYKAWRTRKKPHSNSYNIDKSIPSEAIEQLEEKRRDIQVWQNNDRNAVTSLDLQLLERAKTQWQFGDWESLAEIEKKDIEQHPDASVLALLAAAGKAQRGDLENAGEMMRLSEEWGCDRGKVLQVMMAGVYNSLGCAAATSGQKERAHKHFEESVSISGITGDIKLITKARESEQLGQLGIPQLSRHQDNLSESNTSINADFTGEFYLYDALFYCLLYANQHVYKIGFNPALPEAYGIKDSALNFSLPRGTPGYLVSNETGDFNSAPEKNRLPLVPDTAYQLSGYIACESHEVPMVWVFEYGGGKMLHKHSFSTHNGELQGLFRTDIQMEQAVLGIRLAGVGSLDTVSTHFKVTSGSKVESRYFNDRLTQIESSLIKKQYKQTLTQLEAFITIKSYLDTDFVIPDMHGWAISPDFGSLLISLLEDGGYDAIIEFGSGVSTLIIAKFVDKITVKNPDAAPLCNSFEHLERFLNETQKLLDRAELRHNVELHHAPLEPFTDSDGEQYPYYQCQDSLLNLRNKLPETPKLFVLVDGPPAGTGPHARYPAFPLLMEIFSGSAHFDILLDDYIRTEEREIVKMWETLAERNCLEFFKREYMQLEKQACLISIKNE